MTSVRILIVAAGFAALAVPAAAHHGWSTYTGADVTVTGTVKELRFGQPHDRMTVVAEDGTEWDVWLAPPSRTRQSGFGPDVIEIGQTVTAFGDRRPDRAEIKTERLTVGDAVYDIYPDRLASR